MTKGIDAARRLRADVGTVIEVEVRIPAWATTDLASGLLWVRDMVDEGWYVAWQIDPGDTPVVWLKSWEYGEFEPSWSHVREVPAASANDPDDWLADPAFQRRESERRAEIMSLTDGW